MKGRIPDPANPSPLARAIREKREAAILGGSRAQEVSFAIAKTLREREELDKVRFIASHKHLSQWWEIGAKSGRFIVIECITDALLEAVTDVSAVIDFVCDKILDQINEQEFAEIERGIG